MKISVISFDFWGYDSHIVTELQRQNIQACHIKLASVGHKNFGERFKNTLSKVFLNRNLKYEKRQRFVISELQKLGFQDQILVLNPDAFNCETLSVIRKNTNRLITFLYDNLERFPVKNKLQFFDKIYSFDDQDIEKQGFERLTNYNYLDFLPQEKQNPQSDILYITSFDKKRLKQLFSLEKVFKKLALNYRIYANGKRAWKYKIKKFLTSTKLIFRQKLIKHHDLPTYYQSTKAILDLMRTNQYGLSFRVFEAMALEKKIITDNPKIKQYDFYNPNNILVLNEDFSNLTKNFFEMPYERLPKEIYEKYTLENWVKKVFKLS